MRTHRLRTRLIACVLAVGAVACESTPDFSQQDGAVYAAAFDSLFASGDAKSSNRTIVLKDSTVALPGAVQSSWYVALLHEIAGGDSTLVASLVDRMSKPAPLSQTVDSLRARLGKPVVLMSSAMASGIAHRSDSLARLSPDSPIIGVEMYWKTFYEQFPTAVGSVSVSAIGYNREGDRALVDVSLGCGGLCGGSRIAYLERHDGRWQVVRVQQTLVF